MSTHAYEIAHCIGSEAVRNDRTVIQPALDVLKSRTPLPILTGVDAKDGRFFLVVAWHESSHHHAFMADPIFPAFSELFKPALPDPPLSHGAISMVHAHFARDPSPAFAAPVTEHAYLKPKDGVTVDALKVLVERMCSELDERCVDYAAGAAWASTEEQPDQLLLLIGWKSCEARHTCLAPGAPGHDLRTQLEQSIVASESLFSHVSYDKHQ